VQGLFTSRHHLLQLLAISLGNQVQPLGNTGVNAVYGNIAVYCESHTKQINTLCRQNVTEIGWDGVDWIELAQDRDQWRALVNTVMNLRVP
jgi:hypothetical protein